MNSCSKSKIAVRLWTQGYGWAGCEGGTGSTLRESGGRLGPLVISSSPISKTGLGNVSRRIDGVEIGNQGDGEPVIAVNLVVTADDDAEFTVMARTERGGGVVADVIEINGRVASGVHCAKIAVRLFHQECNRGVGARGSCREDTKKETGPAMHHSLQIVILEGLWLFRSKFVWCVPRNLN
jgi:hypothetical protein